MVMPGRSFVSSGGDYRFGFQGQEKNNDLSGVDGGHLDFKYRIHDARLGRFLSVDPLSPEYPWNSPYSFAENKVGLGIELEGRELLKKDEALFEMIYGALFIKMENFNTVSRKMLEDKFPNYGFVYGIGTGPITGQGMIGDRSLFYNQKQFNVESDINVQDGSPGHFGMIQKAGQKLNGDKNKSVKAWVSSSTPKGRGVLGGIGVAIDIAVFAGNSYNAYMINQDREKFEDQIQNKTHRKFDFWHNISDSYTTSSPMTMAKLSIDVALNNDMIPPEFQNVNSVSQIYNVILYGGDGNDKHDAHYQLGMKIYKNITQKLVNYERKGLKRFDKKNG
jgi:hypothetical protein